MIKYFSFFREALLDTKRVKDLRNMRKRFLVIK